MDCCITSPPYWALRDYKVDGQLGLEPTFQEYIHKLLAIFDEVKRVLKPSGTCWVVMGDTYSTKTKGDTRTAEQLRASTGFPKTWNSDQYFKTRSLEGQRKIETNLPEKSLCKIPQRFEIAMIDHGWIERSDIIWYKPNCMPSSAKDRFTGDYEHVFFFVKSPKKYYFETQYEPHSRDWADDIPHWKNGTAKHLATQHSGKNFANPPNALGRIKRCVWKIPTAPFKEAHFAVFPPKLVEPMIKAGCPEQICKKCGTPTSRIYSEQRIATRPGLDVGNGKSGTDIDPNSGLHKSDLSKYREQIIRQEIGIKSCNCNAGFDSGLVLDPFAGSGTVGLVAAQLARNFVGIEINADYVAMAKKRLEPYLIQSRL